MCVKCRLHANTLTHAHALAHAHGTHHGRTGFSNETRSPVKLGFENSADDGPLKLMCPRRLYWKATMMRRAMITAAPTTAPIMMGSEDDSDTTHKGSPGM